MKYTFKSLVKLLANYFDEDEIDFIDNGNIKIVKFGKILNPESANNAKDKIRVFSISNDDSFYFVKRDVVGRYITCLNIIRRNSLSSLADLILQQMEEYVEYNKKDFGRCRMNRTIADDKIEFKRCLINMKKNDKFQEFYDFIKYKFFNQYNVGVAGFYIRDRSQNNFESFNNSINSVAHNISDSYEMIYNKDFVKEFGIDLYEMANTTINVLFKSHRENGYKKVFYVLKSEEELDTLLSNFELEDTK